MNDNEDSGTRRAGHLRMLAPRLVNLHIWCLQHSLEEIAEHLENAVDVVDRELTGTEPTSSRPAERDGC